MKIAPVAKGIKGIKKTLEKNAQGWHVFLNVETNGGEYRYWDYMDMDIDQLREHFNHLTLCGFHGNGIYFSDKSIAV